MGDQVGAGTGDRDGGLVGRLLAAIRGRPPAAPTPRLIGERAVVAGGSIAGTLAARVLSEWYREVVVVDRDEVLGAVGPRRGASHAVHAHGLHARGYGILAELFPNLLEDARELGLPVRDFGLMRWYFDGRPMYRTETGLLSIAGNRPVLENYLRTRVAELPNVTYRQSTELLGLLSSPDRGRVTGVRLVERGEGKQAFEVGADLVVDATGRGSRLPVWLAELGYERPAEERMTIGLAYTTRTYRRAPGTFDGPMAINPVASPAHPRGAFFGQTATGDVRLSLTGILGDHPPTDPDGYQEYVRSLPVPDIYQAVEHAEPTSAPMSFTFPASVWRHYERLSRFPAGLVVLGDAVCSFNPVYGQGMTAAAMQITALRRHLARDVAADPRPFLRDVARLMIDPWQISTRGDLDFPGVVAPRPLRTRIYNAYLRRVQYASTKDPEVTRAYMRFAGLIDRPRELWRLRLLARVLWLSRDMPAPSARTPAAPARERVAAAPVKADRVDT
ncbi:FAD-dependent oxidoreductase [Micromonospora sp. SD12]|uniref:FAD-dependent oxidoreductase n=1 Tax=Micromonospora sp. SD12 TaxID=3452216 RepID=UPI003F8A6F2F